MAARWGVAAPAPGELDRGGSCHGCPWEEGLELGAPAMERRGGDAMGGALRTYGTERRRDGGGKMEHALVSTIARRTQVRGRSGEGSELGDGAMAAVVWEREEDGVGEKSDWLVDLTRHRWQPLTTVGGSHLLARCSCWHRERRPATGQGLKVVDCLRHCRLWRAGMGKKIDAGDIVKELNKLYFISLKQDLLYELFIRMVTIIGWRGVVISRPICTALTRWLRLTQRTEQTNVGMNERRQNKMNRYILFGCCLEIKFSCTSRIK
jgi:hypothetical protein